MSITINFLSISSFITILILLFLAAAFLGVRRRHKNANILSSHIVFVIAYFVFDYGFLVNSNFHLYTPHFLRTSLPVIFLLFPLTFEYIRVVCTHEDTKNTLRFFHYIPAIIVFFIMLPFYLKNGNEKIALTAKWVSQQKFPWIMHLIYPALLLQSFPYLYFCRKRIAQFQDYFRDSTSSMTKIYRKWLKYVVTIVSLLFGFILVMFILYLFFPALNIYYRFIPAAVSVLAVAIVFRALLQPVIILGRDFDVNEGPEKSERNNTFQNMNHSEYKTKLERLMQKEKAYLDPDISLSIIAQKMNVTRNYASFLINELYGISFIDFINNYRIEKIKKYIEKEDSENLLHLAFKAGFNSKTTFNVTFKKITGMTPTQYRDKLKKESRIQIQR